MDLKISQNQWHCNELEKDKSKEYEIQQYIFMHVCCGVLIPDLMHDILEGAFQYEVKLIILFSLNMFNSRLQSILYD